MLTEKIRIATQDYHQQTEKILVGKMKAMRSLHDYSEILRLFYGYFGGLEKLINEHVNNANLSDYDERRKTAALANDLEALGKPLSRNASGNELPVIENELHAFGAMYVIEGSTLGGQIISKMVQQHLGINDGKGLSFFNGYGEDTGRKWANFQQALNAVAADPEKEDEIIAAANETFAKFKTFLEIG